MMVVMRRWADALRNVAAQSASAWLRRQAARHERASEGVRE